MTDPIPEPLTLREAAQRVIEVVDEPSPQDDGTPGVEVGWYLRWEARHREAVDALRAALARQATPDEHDDLTDLQALAEPLIAYFDSPAEEFERDFGSVAMGDQARALRAALARQATPDHVVPNESPVEETDDTEATPASGGLDVDVLAQELDKHFEGDHRLNVRNYAVCARNIAKRYAVRLTSEATS